MFRDREEAAHQLVEKLAGRSWHDPLILAIPRGGVVTGQIIAAELPGELDVVLAHRLQAPWEPEIGLGAVSEDGKVYLVPHAMGVPGVTSDYVTQEYRRLLADMHRRRQALRAIRATASLAGRSVIVTDDGLATGSTMIAALQVARAHRPRELIVAVPVATAERLQEVARWCDDAVYLLCPHEVHAIRHYYDDFPPVSDEQVLKLLTQATSTHSARSTVSTT
jgi:putative phosphoribosyl transferase